MKEKKKKWITILVGLFIIAIMVSSILSLNSDDGGKIKVNDYKFAQTNKGYLTYKDEIPIIVINNPLELKDFEVDKNALDVSNKEKLYLSIDSQLNLELRNAIQQVYVQTIVLAANTEEKSNEFNIPYKTCKDVKENEGIIMLVSSEENNINLKPDCLEIRGNPDYFLKVFEKLKLVSEGIL
jgi:hypothetical protein